MPVSASAFTAGCPGPPAPVVVDTDQEPTSSEPVRHPDEGPTSVVRTLVCIPAFNEAESIATTLTDLRRMPEVDVLVVSDGSTDATATIASRSGAAVVELPFNLGVGGALQTGFHYAVRHSYDRVVQMDADHQHSVDDLPSVLAGLDDGFDLVIGSRFASGGSSAADYQVGALRKMAMRSLQWLVRIATGQRFSDATSGFRGFSRSLVEHWSEEFPVDYLSDTVEALVNASIDGFALTEVPVTMRNRELGLPSARGARLLYHYLRVVLVVITSFGRRNRRRASVVTR